MIFDLESNIYVPPNLQHRKNGEAKKASRCDVVKTRFSSQDHKLSHVKGNIKKVFFKVH